jgi:DNA-binding MarR family transcriptional regulator
MTKLSDTQVIILSAAAQRDDGNILPLPGSLRGGAAGKVVGALLSRGLIAERITDSMAKADPTLNRIWRNEPDGRGVLLTITPGGLAAIGIEKAADPDAAADEPAAGAPAVADEAPVEPATKRRGRPSKAATTGVDAASAPKTRDGTKQAQVIAMLRRREGATIAQIVEGTAGGLTPYVDSSPGR